DDCNYLRICKEAVKHLKDTELSLRNPNFRSFALDLSNLAHKYDMRGLLRELVNSYYFGDGSIVCDMTPQIACALSKGIIVDKLDFSCNYYKIAVVEILFVFAAEVAIDYDIRQESFKRFISASTAQIAGSYFDFYAPFAIADFLASGSFLQTC
ncbi:hypothetical protein O9G_006407, partial [Rozella allomycis CSF55]